jgi:hypothetical protein
MNKKTKTEILKRILSKTKTSPKKPKELKKWLFN